jgi:hypothetical protein
MTPTPEHQIRKALTWARGLKGRLHRREPNATIPTVIEFHRQGKLIIRAYGDIEGVLMAIGAGVPGLAADSVLLVSDSYAYSGASNAINPITGKHWEIGDMERMAREDAAVERGLLTELLIAHYEARPGDTWQGSLPYKLKGRRLVWDEMQIGELGEVNHELRAVARIPSRLDAAWKYPLAIDDPLVASFGRPQADLDATIAHFMADYFDLRIYSGPKGKPIQGWSPEFN